MPDFLVFDHGSIVLLNPQTPAAKDWVAEYLDPDAQVFGRGVVIERRYFADIYHGITEEAGLTVA